MQGASPMKFIYETETCFPFWSNLQAAFFLLLIYCSNLMRQWIHSQTLQSYWFFLCSLHKRSFSFDKNGDDVALLSPKKHSYLSNATKQYHYLQANNCNFAAFNYKYVRACVSKSQVLFCLFMSTILIIRAIPIVFCHDPTIPLWSFLAQCKQFSNKYLSRLFGGEKTIQLNLFALCVCIVFNEMLILLRWAKRKAKEIAIEWEMSPKPCGKNEFPPTLKSISIEFHSSLLFFNQNHAFWTLISCQHFLWEKFSMKAYVWIA